MTSTDHRTILVVRFLNILAHLEKHAGFTSIFYVQPTCHLLYYHGVFDHTVTPSLIVFRDVGFVSIGTVKAALHIVTIVTQHPENHLTHMTWKHDNMSEAVESAVEMYWIKTAAHLVFESVLQRWREVSRVYPGVIVDVGSEPQQQVHQLIVAHAQCNLKKTERWIINSGIIFFPDEQTQIQPPSSGHCTKPLRKPRPHPQIEVLLA